MPVLDNVQFISKRSLETSASTLTETINTSDPIHQINLSMTALQDGTTQPSISDLLTQLGSTINVKVDGSSIYSTSPTDLYYLNGLAYDRRLPSRYAGTGSGADNQVNVIGLTIPFTREYYPYSIDSNLALDTSDKTIELEVDYPADGNNTDTREITAVAMIEPDGDTQGWVERRTKTLSSPSTGWGNEVDLPTIGNQFLYDATFFQTTNITDGTTTDTTSIEQLRFLINERTDIINSINLEALQILNGMEGTSSGDQVVPDNYARWTADPTKTLENLIPLEEDVKIDINAGDTNEIRVIPGIIMRP